MGEGNGEGGKRECEEEAGDEGAQSASLHLGVGRALDAERRYDQENRKDRERREIESTEESDRGAEHETQGDLRSSARSAGVVRIDREEGSDDREGKRDARPNRKRREDEGHEGGRRGRAPGIRSVQPAPQ